MKKSYTGLSKNLAITVGLGLGVAAVVGVTSRVQAMPSFARQYNVECSTCHTHMPERNAFGEAFERNSFIWPSDKKPSAAQKPSEAIMISGIPQELPISIYARVNSTYNAENTDDGKGPKLDYGNGASMEFFAAGNFKEKVGFMADANFDTADNNMGSVWLSFKEPGNIPVDIKFGTYSPNMSILTMSRHTAAVGYTYQNSSVIAPTGVSITSSQPTLELSKVWGGHVWTSLGLQNNKNNDNAKNNAIATYGSLSWRIMGTDMHGNQPKVSLSSAESFTDYLTLSLGTWGIFGSQHEGTTPSVDNEYDRMGVDMEAYYKAWRLRMTTTWGTEENPPIASTDGKDKDLKSYHALLEYMINSDWLVGASYNNIQIDELKNTYSNFPQDTTAFTVSYLLYQNVRLQAAYIHDTYQPSSSTNNTEYGNRDRVTFNAYFSM